MGRTEVGEVHDPLILVDGNGEAVVDLFLRDDPDGVARYVDAAVHTDEVGEREACSQGLTKGAVVGEGGVGAAVAVPCEAICADVVCVGRLLSGRV